MDKEEFLELLWGLEEILIEADHLERQVGLCGGQYEAEDEACGLNPVSPLRG